MSFPIARSIHAIDGEWREVAEKVEPDGFRGPWLWHIPKAEVPVFHTLELTGEIATIHTRVRGQSVMLASAVPTHLRKIFARSE